MIFNLSYEDHLKIDLGLFEEFLFTRGRFDYIEIIQEIIQIIVELLHD